MTDFTVEPRRSSGPAEQLPTARPPEAVAWMLLADADAGGDADVEGVMSEALDALSPPIEPRLASGPTVTQSWREVLPRVRAALAEARSSEVDAPMAVRAARAAHVLERLNGSQVHTWTSGADGPGRSPTTIAWPDDLAARQPMPPILEDAWWFLCAAAVSADAATETHLRNAVAVLIDGTPYELGPEPPQTIPWPEAVRCAIEALTAFIGSSREPLEILRAGRTASSLLALTRVAPA